MESEQQEYSSWWAHVKYAHIEDEKRKYDLVQVDKIYKEHTKANGKVKKKAFQPKSLEDFEREWWYLVKTARDSADGKEHPYYALIGRLAASREGLQGDELPRIRWPNIDDPPEEPDSSSADQTEGEQQSKFQQQKDERKSSKAKKRAAEVKSFEAFMVNESLESSPPKKTTQEIAPSVPTTSSSHSAELTTEIQNIVQKTVASVLQQSFTQLSQDLQSIQAELSNNKVDTDSKIVAVEQQLSLMQEMLRKSQTSESFLYVQNWVDNIHGVKHDFGQ